jgi:hypothetical protein
LKSFKAFCNSPSLRPLTEDRSNDPESAGYKSKRCRSATKRFPKAKSLRQTAESTSRICAAPAYKKLLHFSKSCWFEFQWHALSH